jgi:hypothetical protein
MGASKEPSFSAAHTTVPASESDFLETEFQDRLARRIRRNGFAPHDAKDILQDVNLFLTVAIRRDRLPRRDLARFAYPLSLAAIRSACRVRNKSACQALATLTAEGRVRKTATGYLLACR